MKKKKAYLEKDVVFPKRYIITENYVKKWISYLPTIFEDILVQYEARTKQIMPIKVVKETKPERWTIMDSVHKKQQLF